MPVRARFRPHPRGFGFLTPVDADGVTPTTFDAADQDGVTRTFDSAFVPPDLAGRMLADDLVDATVTVDAKGASAAEVSVVDRPRRMLLGRVERGPARLVVSPDPSLGSGWVDLDPGVEQKVAQAVGRQVVVLVAEGDEGKPVARALVAGPFVHGSPQHIRAAAVVVALGGAAPSLVPGGAAGAGLDEAGATATHTRVIGLLAGGGRGGAVGLDPAGATPVPGADLTPVDRTAEACVTIDSASTRDIDDALTAGWDGTEEGPVQVVVHIADVAGVVAPGSPADLYARTVATTAYLRVGENAPMLDPVLSEGALSLVAGEDRDAVSVSFAVSPRGEVLEVDVEVATVRSAARLTYGAVEAWLDGDGSLLAAEGGEYAETVDAVITNLAEAARRLGAQRDARTTLEDLFEDAELEPGLKDGRLAVLDAEPHAAAYRLVERLMVAANEAVAAWLVERGVPALYRAHVGLDPERHDRLAAAAELAGVSLPSLSDEHAEAAQVIAEVVAAADRLAEAGREEERDLLVTAATGGTARATYDPDPSAHVGLAAGAYTHFTSPIRRYADLVVHRQIRAALAGEAPPHDVDELRGLAGWLDARAGAVNRASARERGDLWARLLDRDVLDGPEEAVVTGLTPNGMRIRLPRLGLTGFVTAERALGLPRGQRGSFEVDEHGLTTTSGPWRVGGRVKVRFATLDDTDRPVFLLGDAPAR
ncbi:MAG: RNB domain-containing ribonuclease [Actinomycetes bacterium]